MEIVIESNELFHQVLSWLDVKSLVQAAAVSLRWYLIANNNALWQEHANRGIRGQETQKLLELFKSKSFVRLLYRYQRYICNFSLDSARWQRFCSKEKWLARIHLTIQIDTINSTQKAELAELYSAFADLMEEEFHDDLSAIIYLELAISNSLDPVRLMHNVALLYDKHDDLDQAEQWFAQSYQLNPQYQSNLCNYAVFLDERRHDYDRALFMYEAAISNDPRDLNSLSAFTDFLTFKRPALDRVHSLFRQAMDQIASTTYLSEDGQELKIIIQYAEFLVYICHHHGARDIFHLIVQRHRNLKVFPSSASQLFFCIGFLSYAISMLFAHDDLLAARQLVVEAMAMPVYHGNSHPMLEKYKLVAACSIYRISTPLSLDASEELQQVIAPVNGLLYYFNEDIAAAIKLWSSCIHHLDHRENAFACYCLGVVFHLRDKRGLAKDVLTKAFAIDVHRLEFQNLSFIARQHLDKPIAKIFLDILLEFSLAHLVEC
ncbi:hypothetical protein THRCLA_08225 [Thraustotheca clavata]|uniref:F-box domain-containing protein n=1 Tax=Thraustotheca clavata TaxID=74557 RepID=A0A1V9Z8F1_9STRA|nr:hypothetical protein THRCLA_08225 [Thraustotheca clavata]